MKFLLIFGSLTLVTIIFYIIFLGIGFAGVPQNRKAQNLDRE